MSKQPSRDDPSKPKQHGYAYKKQFYQSADVAAVHGELVRHAGFGRQVSRGARQPAGAAARSRRPVAVR